MAWRSKSNFEVLVSEVANTLTLTPHIIGPITVDPNLHSEILFGKKKSLKLKRFSLFFIYSDLQCHVHCSYFTRTRPWSQSQLTLGGVQVVIDSHIQGNNNSDSHPHSGQFRVSNWPHPNFYDFVLWKDNGVFKQTQGEHAIFTKKELVGCLNHLAVRRECWPLYHLSSRLKTAFHYSYLPIYMMPI